MDVARLRHLLASQHIQNHDVVIFDRYVYDQIANVYSQSFAARAYGKALLQLAPVPNLAFVLDASPALAFARKPEYPLEFMHQNRENFLRLQEIVPELIIVSEAGLEDVTNEILTHICHSRLVQTSSLNEFTVDSVGRLKNSCRVQSDPTASI